MTLRDEILAADDLGSEVVEVPEWTPEPLTVRGLTAGEVEEFGKLAVSPNGNSMNLMASVVVKATLDADGARVFEDGDVVAVSSKAPDPVKRLFDAIQRVSGLEQLADGGKD